MSENEIVVALDVGTTKICVLVGDVDPGGSVRFLGMGQTLSEGLRKGVVVDIVAASRNISAAVDAARRATGVEIRTVVVGVTGDHVSSLNSRGATSITHSNREITEHDVQRVLETARAIPVPAGREVIHVLPRGFSVDGQGGVRHPVGMSGYHLEVETHIVTGASSFLQNVFKSVEAAGLVIDTVVLEPVATCEAILSPGEKELGVVVADIGGGTTDIAVVMDGSIAYSMVIPVGGNHVTHDLAIGLKTSRSEAERFKKDYGCALVSMVVDTELLEMETSEGQAPRQISRQAIADIIEPRMQELFRLIGEDLRSQGFQDNLTGAVLSGGGSLLHGAPELAQEILGLPTRVGRPRNVAADGIDLSSPAFATAVGLLYYGAARCQRERQEASTQRFLSKALEQLRLWIAHLFAG